ncbi:UDP-glycosyltransferase UGT5 [Augochlora pura]
MRHCLSVLLIALACCHFGSGLRILGLFPLNGRSHWVMAERLMVALAERGHQVDVVTQFPMKKPPPNYTEYSLAGTLKPVLNNLDAKTASEFNTMDFEKLVVMTGVDICNLLAHENVQRFIKNPPNDPPYDLIITEVT